MFLHIGTHKTGSTSIQWALTKSRALLAARGICYPLTGAPASAQFGQHELAWSLVRRPGHLPVNMRGVLPGAQARAALWGALRAEVDASGAHTIVLSSEEFDMFDADEIADLARELRELRDYAVTPVVFLRNAAEFLESSYRTSVAHSGGSRDIEDFVANQRSRLDYAAMIEDWRRAFGGAVVFAYDDPDIRRSTVAAFFELLGVGVEQLSADSRRTQNESMPAFVCALGVFLRRQGVAEPDVRNWFKALQSAGLKKGPDRYSLLPAALREALSDRFYDEVVRILNDPAPTIDFRGFLSAGCEVKKRTVIDSPAAALLALAQELNAMSGQTRPAEASPDPGHDETQWDELWLRQASHGDVASLPALAPLERQQLLHGTSGVAAMQGALKFRRLIHRHLGAPPKGRLLDFGCGWGRHIRVFLKDFAPDAITGVDIDPENLRLCRELLPQVAFVQSEENKELPIPAGSMDLVISFSVFSHINEESAAFWLNELARVTKPGGSLVVTSWGQALFDIFARKRATGRSEYAWEDNIARAFDDFEGVERRYRGGEFVFGKHMSREGALDADVYGISLMPKDWIERNTPLRVAQWFEDPKYVPQTTYFLSKPL